MAKMMNLSIDLTKIDKTKIIDGKKGKYLNLTVAINDEKDQYDNDVSAWQGQDQQEREAGLSKNYLGNGRVFWSSDSNATTQTAHQSNQANQAAQDLSFLD